LGHAGARGITIWDAPALAISDRWACTIVCVNAEFGKTTPRRDIPMATTDELLDVLMKDYKKPEDLICENGLLKQLTKRH